MASIQEIAPSKWSLGSPAAVVKPRPRMIVYGEPGIGKTSFGISAPNAVLLPTEDGALGAECVRLPSEGKIDSWTDLLTACKWLLTNEHDREWVIIDTLNAAEHLCASHVCERDFSGVWTSSRGKEGYDSFGKGDKATGVEFRQLLNALDSLQQERGLGVILLAHVGLHKQANALGADFFKFGADLNKHAWSVSCAWADQVGFACRELRASTRDGEHRAKASAVGSERWLVWEGGPGVDAKSRVGYELPERCLLDWDEYQEAAKSDRSSEMIEQIRDLLAKNPGLKEVVSSKLGGTITKAKLMAAGEKKLERLVGWILANQQPAIKEGN